MKKNSHNIFLSSASAIHDKLVNSKKQKWTEKNCIKADSSGSSIVITIFLKKIFFAENERKKNILFRTMLDSIYFSWLYIVWLSPV